MDIQELRQQSNQKVLLRGPSASGKTRTSCQIVLKLLDEGLDVMYADTENEGSTTLINLIDQNGLDDDVVDGLNYVQVDDYESLMEVMEQQGDYDVVVIDTLDHKHSYVLKGVTDAKTEADADWNEYAQIYAGEKNVMEQIGKPDAHIIATLDPDSGKMDKPKGAQTNIHGYFSIVIYLHRSGGEWGSKIVNWVGRSDLIGVSPNNLDEAVSEQILKSTEL